MSKLSYQYDEFIKYKDINNKLPQHLVPYCLEHSRHNKLDISHYKEIMSQIITSIKKGDNPNDIIFRNYVKHYINTVNQTNYNDFLQKLKALDYSSAKNIQFLASELIICAIRYPISVKGFTFNEDPKYKSVPEICADIAKYFSSFMIKTEEKNIGFHDELLKICQHFFLDFIDLGKAIDENNVSTSDNYKGFMTFLGLLYSRGIINIKIIIDCIDKIKRNIFCNDSHIDARSTDEVHSCIKHIGKMYGSNIASKSVVESICFFDCNQTIKGTQLVTKRKHTECINLHKGYEHLINHVIHSLNIKINDIISTYDDKLKLVEKYNKLLITFKTKPNHPDVTSFIISNRQLIETKHEDVSIKSFDDFLKLYKNEKEAFIDLNNLIEMQIKNIKDNCENIINITNTMIEYLAVIINSHQEIINNNQIYKSLNKNQLITPFKPHIIITHNSIGQTMNGLIDKIDKINKINNNASKIVKYSNVTIMKTTD